MALFKKIFSKKEDKVSKGFYLLTVDKVEKNTSDTAVVSLTIPEELRSTFQFKPGQYLTGNFKTSQGNFHRSYSICSDSADNSTIQIACKKIEGGKVSSHINDQLQAGTQIEFMKPEGNFILDSNAKKVTAICAGSGITPIMSMIQYIERVGGQMDLFYGSRNENEKIFKSEIDRTSDKISKNYFLSGENKDGFIEGRITPKTLEEKVDLNSDAFYLCGPEGLIFSTKDFLVEKGVPENKIRFELFTTPVSVKAKDIKSGSATCHVAVTLNGETNEMDVDTSKMLLDSFYKNGMEAPFSCKGGVCCTCKAKVQEGSAEMKLNLSLTDKEIEEGYILTCQAVATSDTLKLTFDE
ncbi:MAG: 2Fe-2S iron-sulfur cluster binding domain-containing protein [Crocinitomicaceae bacterium]|nr:2Fe-2S iron-sulfur cluster binding domain-containing protein [Crocinitomicaceae bacterium]